ncbi:Hypothetical protein FKW44_019590 [Caligus rogercresseyi]|uniref:Uncharacterized protein n=1 Tax=Caligus rogercresseyi TaxID=217165 RepID=A0A7T8GWA4_CALRO|nr:Hypothetical protein FKW44_019590 [Caligus rogercresseyi]
MEEECVEEKSVVEESIELPVTKPEEGNYMPVENKRMKENKEKNKTCPNKVISGNAECVEGECVEMCPRTEGKKKGISYEDEGLMERTLKGRKYYFVTQASLRLAE